MAYNSEHHSRNFQDLVAGTLTGLLVGDALGVPYVNSISQRNYSPANQIEFDPQNNYLLRIASTFSSDDLPRSVRLCVSPNHALE
jgi:ADP-ribosylglycohydrolase